MIYQSNIVIIGLSDEDRGSIACFVDVIGSCTNCNPDAIENYPSDEICPEWTNSDVMRVIRTQMKQSAALAAILIIYATTALRFGFTLKTLVARYEIDYV